MKFLSCIFSFLSLFSYNGIFEENLSKTFDISSSNIKIVNSDIFFYQNETECYIYKNGTNVLLEEGELKEFETIDNYTYLIIKKNNDSLLFKINLETLSFTKEVITNVIYSDIKINNNLLYLVGNSSGNLLITSFDFSFKLINQKEFLSDGFENFNNLIIKDDYIYLNVYKEALSNNSIFVSTGNLGEYKSVLLKIDLDFNINKIFYFDHQEKNEMITSFLINKDKIYINLKTNTSNYFYLFDLDLNVCNYFNLNNNHNNNLIPHHKSCDYILYLENDDNKLNFIYYQDQDHNKLYTSKYFGSLVDYKIIDGELNLLLKNDSILSLIKISEYEVIYNKPLVLNKQYYNFDKDDNFLVESFFEDLKFTREKENPILSPNMCGTFNLTYSATRKNGKKLAIDTILVIEGYTNFIDKGIYQKGKVLEFFGKCILDGVEVYYGHELNDLGVHEIIITDANANSYKYQIYVVDNYYNLDNFINIPSDIDVEKSSDAYITLDIGTINVTNVIIDKNDYQNFMQTNNLLKINLPKKDDSYINTFYIDGLEYESNGQTFYLEVNKKVTVNYLNQNLECQAVKEINNEKINLDFNVTDLSKQFLYLLLKKGENEEIVTISDDFIISENEDIEILLVYKVNNLVLNKSLLKYQNTKESNLNIEIFYDNGSLCFLGLNLDVPKNINNLKKLDIDEVSYLHFFSEYKSTNFLKSIIFISIMIAVVLSLFFGGYLVFRRIKFRNSF